jgi:acyl carrier protein
MSARGGVMTVDMQVGGVEPRIISLLRYFVEDWGVDHPVHPQTRLVADLEFESIDIIQLVVAIEQQFGRRNFRFDELLMKDGRYVDDLSVRQIASFVEAKLAIA